MTLLGILWRTLMVVLYVRGGRSLALQCGVHSMINTVPMFPAGFSGFDPWLILPGTVLVLVVVLVLARRSSGP